MFLQGKIDNLIITDLESCPCSPDELNAPIMAVDRHRMMSDGNGVTTLVCFYGCPLSCKYCLNPQCSDDNSPRKDMSPIDLYQYVWKDDLYFQATGGGVTFGGGEPLCYSTFITVFHELCRGNNWNLRVETSLNVQQKFVEEVMPFVHEFFVDIKDMNPNIYKAYTGMDNGLVKDNLRMLVRSGLAENIIAKVPYIEGFNTVEDIDKTIDELKQIGVHRFQFLNYITSTKINVPKKANRGKRICRILKEIRKTIAKANDIEYVPDECSYDGPCLGTCPKCEQELKLLSEEFYKRKEKGFII